MATSRRGVLVLMGVMGVAAVAATGQALSGGHGLGPPAGSTPAGSAAGCTVRCSRQCAYPGRCGRYVDENGNRRCDLGESL